MSLSTLRKPLTADEKKQKVEDARLYHSTLLEDNGVAPTEFNFKSVFMHKRQKVIGLFPNEFTKKNGFLLELIDSNLDPINPLRTVYKMEYRENFEDIYEMLPKGTYAVPLEDLIEVKPKIKGELNPTFEVEETIIKSKTDEHYSHLTIKDLASILWKEPVSEKEWLNDLINEHNQ